MVVLYILGGLIVVLQLVQLFISGILMQGFVVNSAVSSSLPEWMRDIYKSGLLRKKVTEEQ